MRLRLPLALFAVAAALSGCTTTAPTTPAEPSGDAPTGTEPAAAGPTPSCALVSAAVIKASLAIAVSEPKQTTSESTITCDYVPADGAHTVVITFRTGEDKDSFSRGRRTLDTSGQPTSDVSGLLDEAYVSSTEFGDTVTNSLVARKGQVTMSVAAVASVEAERSLVAKVLGGSG
jgi:hypothetical protein